MSMGTGIFLAALLIAPIYIYQITKDRWNWGKGARRLLVGIGAIAALIVLASVAIWISTLPTTLTQYADLKFGMSMAEVRYIKGIPDSVYSLPVQQKDTPIGWLTVTPVKELKDKSIEEFKQWSYSVANSAERIDVEFDKTGKLSKIDCFSRGYFQCPSLLGFHDGSSEGDIVAKLGNPTKESIDKASGVKSMFYDKLNARFWLQKTQVYMLGIGTKSLSEN